jgi:Flp pilus assembly protein TadG
MIPNKFDRAISFVQRLLRARGGNVLMTFGFALVPLSFATGMTIDYSRAARVQTRLNAITDAAALAGVTPAMLKKRAESATAAVNLWDAQAGIAQCQGGTVNRVIFNACGGPGYGASDNGTVWSGNDNTITISVTDSTTGGFKRTITMSYQAASSNIFANLLGMASIPIGGTSTTKASNAQYIDVHVALDTSQSMGLAASNTDALALWNATKTVNGPNSGCTFGCHVYSSSDYGYNNAHVANDTIAGNYGIRLRIDELRDATTDMIQSAIDNQPSSGNLYRFGLYRVGASHSTIASLSNNLTSLKTTAATITLGPNNAGGVGDTNIPDTMTKMLSTITTHGDGSTQAKARAFFFLVTDGVTDIAGSCTYGHCTRPIDPATCQAFKDNGITVGIVYTTYLPVYSDPTNPSNGSLRPEYANLVKDFSWLTYVSPNPSDNSLDISPALQACASPGWFFEANDGSGIHTAMQTLFAQVARTAQIAN